MSKNNRSIEDFPYSRENAERIISMSREIITKMAGLSEYLTALLAPSNGPHDLLGHSFFDALDFVLQFEELLARTFPELLPIDWGFDENAR